MSAPVATKPARGAVVPALPPFAWRTVGGADHYEFEIGADPSFNSPVTHHSSFGTKNTWATLDETVPNGNYWWHVRAISKDGGVSGWSPARPFHKEWKSVPSLLSPANGAAVQYPSTPIVLRWSAVPYAAKYLVYLATDSNLGSLVGKKPIETAGVTFSPSVALPIGTYYWAVVPVDAAGNNGVRSRVASFTWAWNSKTTPRLDDLVPATEQFDPQFSWTPVAGAARYEIEINPSHEWSVSSRVCCADQIAATTFTPQTLLQNNRYYWRVRAINIDDNAGQWNEGPPFDKVFDNFGDASVPTIKNLHMEDEFGTVGGPGFATSSPIIVWDPVPGAAAYELDVVSYINGRCVWDKPSPVGGWHGWHGFTSVNAWTPAADAKVNTPPYPVPKITADGSITKSFTQDGGTTELQPGSYCVRIRAHSDHSLTRRDIFGNYTYFPDPNGVAFTFTGLAGGGGAPVYLQPTPNQVLRSTPVFRWQPFAPAYWVIVAKDPNFTTVVDYAFTKIPAWAPREDNKGVGEWLAGDGVWTYTDEETQYYWAVLGATLTGVGLTVDPHFANPQAFLKQSQPPAFVTPANDGAAVVGAPTFRWTPVSGALSYQLQVSEDRNFGTLLDDVTTDSTEYTALRAYPSNAALYARVRVQDGNKIELTWSTPRRFRNTLATPVPSADNQSISDFIPTWTWKPVQGALSYELHVDLPNGTKKDFFKIIPSAFTATTMTGTGVFRWQVRAVFPGGKGGKESVGPFSREVAFTRTIRPPEGARALVGSRSVVLVWNPRLGADHYRVQIATTPDFAHRVENRETDNPNFAPDLDGGGWSKATTFYWRVSAIDADHNTGNYTPVRSFKLHLPGGK